MAGNAPHKTGDVERIIQVVVVRLPRPMEGNGVTPIFRSLQNCQFHHRRLESLAHFSVLYIYTYIYIYIYIYIMLSTTVSHFWTLRMPFVLYCICIANNIELVPPQSVTAIKVDQLFYSPNYYIKIYRLNLLPTVRIEPSTARSKLKSNALTDYAIYPGPTTARKQFWICDICHRQIQVRKQISIRCNRIEYWVHLRCADIRLARYSDTWTCHQHK